MSIELLRQAILSYVDTPEAMTAEVVDSLVVVGSKWPELKLACSLAIDTLEKHVRRELDKLKALEEAMKTNPDDQEWVSHSEEIYNPTEEYRLSMPDVDQTTPDLKAVWERYSEGLPRPGEPLSC